MPRKRKEPAAPSASEHSEQVAIMQWRSMRTGKHPELVLLHAIPNGEWRSKSGAARLKAEGVLKGIPDLHLPVITARGVSLYIELKKVGGKPSEEQLDIIALLRHYGNRVEICEGSEAAIRVIEDYLDFPPEDRTEFFT